MFKSIDPPYPLKLYSTKVVWQLGGIVLIFLLLFQPFGLGQVKWGIRIWIISGILGALYIVFWNQKLKPKNKIDEMASKK